MIDTDKYEGHQVSEFKTSVAGPRHSWVTHQHKLGAKDAMFVNHATAALVADAPLLLAFYKRIKEIMDMDEIEEIERVELILQEMSE
tara:strand:- start:577 stop:837 length:261 start_codon:yes stop_codon:yes gene_type:complete